MLKKLKWKITCRWSPEIWGSNIDNSARHVDLTNSIWERGPDLVFHPHLRYRRDTRVVTVSWRMSIQRFESMKQDGWVLYFWQTNEPFLCESPSAWWTIFEGIHGSQRKLQKFWMEMFVGFLKVSNRRLCIPYPFTRLSHPVLFNINGIHSTHLSEEFRLVFMVSFMPNLISTRTKSTLSFRNWVAYLVMFNLDAEKYRGTHILRISITRAVGNFNHDRIWDG
jgi:hypothetical protein